jgi:tetratricopeptide (TPR) repeat protein
MLAGTMTLPLGPFDLITPFAEGGMGEIWRGRHRASGTWVAAKILTARGLEEERLVSAIHAEIRAAAALAHPSIVWVYDAGTADAALESRSQGRLRAGCPWFVMEMARGGTLQKRAFDLDWIAVRRVLLDLLDALGHAHARGVIHRDIKPSNVLFMGAGTRIKLADFGMVYALASTDSPLSGGTPAFMAPEQFEGDGRIQGPWTDLYSVGCLAWTLVSGHRPFHSDDGPAGLYRQHAIKTVPRLAPRFPVPDGLQEWVEGLMAKDPGNRYQRAADAARALAALPMPTEVGTVGTSARSLQADTETQRTTIAIEHELRERPARRLAPDAAPKLAIPADWRPLRAERVEPVDRRAPMTHLPGAGLGLFGLRELPFVGREAERDALWTALHDVRSRQRARVVVLRGPSGYGKSRLAEWVGRRAHEVGAAEVFVGTHQAVPGPRQGLAGLVGRAVRAHGLDQHELRDHIEQRLPDAPPWAGQGAEALCVPFLRTSPTRPVLQLETAAERNTVVSRVLRELTRGRVAVVLLDDVQWGLESLEWASWVLERQDLGPALLVLTVQEEALVERMEEEDRIDALAEHGAVTLPIGPLDPDTRRDLSRSLLVLEPDLADQLADRTAGNPLFAVQMVGDWVARGLLENGEHGFGLKAHTGDTVPLPEAVEAVWDTRIQAVLADAPEWERPLWIAALLGMDVHHAEWSRACANARTQAHPTLVLRLLAERLAVLDPANRGGAGAVWRFAHGMLRETLVDAAERSPEAARLHRACADALREGAGSGADLSDRLARHLLGAGDEDAAIDALYDASIAVHRSALPRAVQRMQLRETLLAAREQTPSQRRVDGWIQLARMARLHGDLAGSRAHARNVLDHAVERSQVARAHLELAIVERMDANQLEAIEHLEIANTMARELGDRKLLGHVLVEQSAARQQVGDVEGAEAVIRDLLRLDGAAPNTLHNARMHLAWILGATGRPEEGLEVLEDARDVILASGRRHTMANFHNTEGELARMIGDLDRAELAYREAMSLSERLGYPFHSLTLNLGLVELERDHVAEAERWFTGVVERDHVSPVFQLYAGLGLITTAALRGDWRTVTHLKPAMDDAPAVFQPDLCDLLERTARAALDAEQVAIARWAVRHAQEQASQLADPDRQARVDALERQIPVG